MKIGHHYNFLTKLTPCINNIIELAATLKRILCVAKTYNCSSAECERGFSAANNTVTPMRNRLSAKSLASLQSVYWLEWPISCQLQAAELCEILGLTRTSLVRGSKTWTKSTAKQTKTIMGNTGLNFKRLSRNWHLFEFWACMNLWNLLNFKQYSFSSRTLKSMIK